MGKGLINPSSNINLVIGHIQNTKWAMQAISKWSWEIFATKGVTIATSHGSPPIINYDKQNHELRCCLPKLEYKFCFSSGSIEWFYTVCQKVSHWDTGDL